MKQVVSIVHLAGAVAAAAALSACGQKQERAEEVRPVTTVQVASSNGDQEVRYTGDVRARYETALGFRVPGKIVVREVEVGSSVKRGQLLARLDPSDFRLNIEAARSQLAAAQADFLQAKDDLALGAESRRRGGARRRAQAHRRPEGARAGRSGRFVTRCGRAAHARSRAGATRTRSPPQPRAMCITLRSIAAYGR